MLEGKKTQTHTLLLCLGNAEIWFWKEQLSSYSNKKYWLAQGLTVKRLLQVLYLKSCKEAGETQLQLHFLCPLHFVILTE